MFISWTTQNTIKIFKLQVWNYSCHNTQWETWKVALFLATIQRNNSSLEDKLYSYLPPVDSFKNNNIQTWRKKRLTLNDEVNSVYTTCSSSTDELKEAGFVDNATHFKKVRNRKCQLQCFLFHFNVPPWQYSICDSL